MRKETTYKIMGLWCEYVFKCISESRFQTKPQQIMFIGNFIGPFDRNCFYAKLGGFVFFGHVYLTCWKMVKDSMNENICIFPNSLNGLKGSNTSILLKTY